MFDDQPEMMRVIDAARALGVSRTVAYQQAHLYEATGGREGLPVVRIGRTMRVPKQALERWINSALRHLTGDDGDAV